MTVRIKKSELWKAIREHCYECSGLSKKEVRYCQAKRCRLWPYRKGSGHAMALKDNAGPAYKDDPRNTPEILDPVEQAIASHT